MKKTFLMLVILGLSMAISCVKEQQHEDINSKMQIFENCLNEAKIHSDYLEFINKNHYSLITSDKDIFYNEHKKISFEFVNSSSKFSEFSKEKRAYMVELSNIRYEKEYFTKSSSLQKVDKLGEELLTDINVLITSSNLDYNSIIRTVLMGEKYMACSDDEFLILSIAASTYLDSIQYWEKNINSWISSDETLMTKGWSWSRVWGYVKQFAQADAEAGLETAIGSAFLGPVSLEAAFVGAGVGSAFECGKTIASML